MVALHTLQSQVAFVDDDDRNAFLVTLDAAASLERVSIHAYSLLDREVVLLVTPAEADSLSRVMQAVGRSYVAAFNRRHQRRGTLWEGRFRSTVVDEQAFLIDAMRWLEWRPVIADEAHNAYDYPWSSAGHHIGRRGASIVTDHPRFWQLGNTPFEREATYRALLELQMGSDRMSQIESALLKGWPLGSQTFIEAIGKLTTRRVQPMARGRPKRNSE